MYGCIFEISLVYHALSVFSYIDQWTCVWTASLLRLLQLKRCFILFDMAYSFYTPYKTYQNQIFEWRFNFVLYLASPSGVAKNVTLKKILPSGYWFKYTWNSQALRILYWSFMYSDMFCIIKGNCQSRGYKWVSF